MTLCMGMGWALPWDIISIDVNTLDDRHVELRATKRGCEYVQNITQEKPPAPFGAPRFYESSRIGS